MKFSNTPYHLFQIPNPFSYDRHKSFVDYRTFATGSLLYEPSLRYYKSNRDQEVKLTHFKPPYRRPTPPTLQGFIGSHKDERMKAIIIKKNHQRQMHIPIPFKMNNASPKHKLNGLNSAFRLTIRLGMKTGTQLRFSTQPILKRPPKPRFEFCTPIRYDG